MMMILFKKCSRSKFRYNYMVHFHISYVCVKCHMSYVICHTSYVKCRISEFIHHTSHRIARTSPIASHIPYPMSDASCSLVAGPLGRKALRSASRTCTQTQEP